MSLSMNVPTSLIQMNQISVGVQGATLEYIKYRTIEYQIIRDVVDDKHSTIDPNMIRLSVSAFLPHPLLGLFFFYHNQNYWFFPNPLHEIMKL